MIIDTTMIILSLWSIQHMNLLLSDDSLAIFAREGIVINERCIERKVNRLVSIVAATFD